MTKYIVYSVFSILLLCTACEKTLFKLKYPDTPIGNFEALWNEFDQLYGLFETRNVDWDEVYVEFRPQISDDMNEKALYEVLVEMLKTLDDSHAALIPVGTDFEQYIGGPGGRIDTVQDFNLEVVKENYLREPKEAGYFMLHDWIAEDVGYIHIYGFSDGEEQFAEETAICLDALKDAKAIIIDIRGGYGGEDIAGKTIASQFTMERRLYMTTKVKNGVGKNDFAEPEEWYIEPSGDFQYTKPVFLLTNRQTLSARETFQLAMMTLPDITMVGDTTAGGFSNQINRELPNGWAYSLSIGDWRTPDGTSYEGRGIPPNVLIQNKRSDLLEGKDEVLEKALELAQ
ncbi:MAG: S41 family peptidase [Bacteroidota bacterium]